jgi:anti-sigma factor RsiW
MTRPMIHEESTLPIHAYLDGELDPTNALAVEKRMATDPALAAECERVEVLQRLIHAHLPREAPPPGLRTRVETAVGMRRPRVRFAHTQFSWRALAASIAVTAVVAGSATSMLRAPSPSDMVRDGIVDAHIRSLMASQPIDVASSDRHTLKPWFNGRSQAPRVVDLASQDFPLVGGRIDVVSEVPVWGWQRRDSRLELRRVDLGDQRRFRRLAFQTPGDCQCGLDIFEVLDHKNGRRTILTQPRIGGIAHDG